MKPRLLVVTSTFPQDPADASTPPFVLQLCTRLAHDFEVDVLAPHARGARTHEQWLGLNVFRYRYAPERLELLSGPGGILAQLRASVARAALVPLFLAGQLLAVWRLLRRGRYAVVHAHWIVPQGLIAGTALWLLRLGTPLVVTVHGADAFALKGALARGLKRWTARRAAAVAVVSPALRDHMATEVPAAKLRVLPMGVDLAQLFVPPLADSRAPGTLLFVGRLVEKKGADVLLEALARLRATHPTAQLSIAGSGPEESALRLQSTRLGLDQNVRFLGPLPQQRLAELYRQAQVVVFPSRVARDGDQEGLGLVPIEALGCECAVIASDIPAVRHTIVHGTTGLLAQAASADDLAVQLRRLLDDPALGQRLGQQGRRHVMGYDWDVAAGAYAQLLTSAIRNSAGAPVPAAAAR